jgi:hypothetical protein
MTPGESDPHRFCPSCGYSRVGIDAEALCPECGADGLDGCVVLQGVARRGSRALLLVGFALCVPGTVVAVTAMIRAPGRVGPCELTALLGFLAAIVSLGFSIARTRGVGGDSTITWIIHIDGVSIREGSSHVVIPRDSIGRIDCMDSLFGQVSQLMLVRSRKSLRGMMGRTHVLYIRGPKSKRRNQWRTAREALGI